MKILRTLREVILIVIAAAIIGFATTYISKQGLFAEKDNSTSEVPNWQIIAIEKAKALYDSHTSLFIDSRSVFDYNQGHIQDAINVPLDEIDAYQKVLDDLSKNKTMIVYCDGAECNSSIELAIKLSEKKFTDVKVFFGGWQEWKTNNFPIAKSESGK